MPEHTAKNYADYLLALTVACPHRGDESRLACAAGVGQPCRSVMAEHYHRLLAEVYRQPVHQSRIELAKQERP